MPCNPNREIYNTHPNKPSKPSSPKKKKKITPTKMRQPVTTLLLLAQTAYASLLPDPTNLPSIQRSTHIHTDSNTNSTLEFTRNSGICETTPGVNQYSGYLSIGEHGGMHMWFWYYLSSTV